MRLSILRAICLALAANALAAVPTLSAQSATDAARSPALADALARHGLVLEYHWVLSGTPSASARRYRDPVRGGWLELNDTVACDLSGVKAVLVDSGPTGYTVALRLNDAGARRTLATTTAHQGQLIGVLVNDQLISVAQVMSPLSGVLPVRDELPRGQADTLAARLRAVLPPQSPKPAPLPN